jgi:excisionase family DNA binding protein
MDNLITSLPPTPVEAQLAAQSSRHMSALLEHAPDTITLTSPQIPNTEITLSVATLRIIAAVMDQVGRGFAVSISPVSRELSTKEAAEVLNVSRPFVIKLLDEGKIAHRKVGSHRRVRLEDLLEYRATMERECADALDKLTSLGQEMEG